MNVVKCGSDSATSFMDEAAQVRPTSLGGRRLEVSFAKDSIASDVFAACRINIEQHELALFLFSCVVYHGWLIDAHAKYDCLILNDVAGDDSDFCIKTLNSLGPKYVSETNFLLWSIQ